MEAYSEALSYEVAPHGIRIGLVQPGDLCTSFTSKRRRAEKCTPSSSYHDRFQRCMANVESMETKGQAPEKVADAIVRMASNRRMPLRRRVTQPLEELFLFLRHYGPSPIYHRVLRSVVGDGS